MSALQLAPSRPLDDTPAPAHSASSRDAHHERGKARTNMAAKDSRYIVGIDLGTTHTVVAYVDTNAGIDAPISLFEIEQLVAPGEIESRPLLHSLRYHAAPSELGDDDRQLPWHPRDLEGVPDGVIGQLARDLGAKVPGRLVASAKSWLSHPVGRPHGGHPALGRARRGAEDLARRRRARATSRTSATAWDHRFPDEPLVRAVGRAHRARVVRRGRPRAHPAGRPAGRALPACACSRSRRPRSTTGSAGTMTQIDELVGQMHLALVVDVGGGTTDLTLIQVELRESGPRLTRVAVGDHLMLGGDNMDLALAHDAEGRLGAEGQARRGPLHAAHPAVPHGQGAPARATTRRSR